MHLMYPVPVCPLVEIIRGISTTEEVRPPQHVALSWDSDAKGVSITAGLWATSTGLLCGDSIIYWGL